jgi:hypothetical protein
VIALRRNPRSLDLPSAVVTTIMPYTAQITELLQRFREGHREDVFFGLLEMDREALPELMGAFRVERDVQVRAFIVEVIWQAAVRIPSG